MSSSYDSPYSLCIFRRRAALLRFSRSLLYIFSSSLFFFFFQAEDGIRDWSVTWSSDVCSSDLLVLVLVLVIESLGWRGKNLKCPRLAKTKERGYPGSDVRRRFNPKGAPTWVVPAWFPAPSADRKSVV